MQNIQQPDDMKDDFQMLAKTLYGLEQVLAGELTKLGASDVTPSNRAVSFRGNKELLYRANYYLRTAINILVPIETFFAKNEDELYKKIYEIDWQKYISINSTFALEATVHSTIFTHSHYAALKTKDAIVDQFRSKIGKRPYIDTENPDLLFHLYISEKKCTISLNSSGEPLFKRGYRIATAEAPLNEVLAAGLLAISGWQPTQNLIDPMCGSGTILIEAAMIANAIPPGIFRKKYGFESWANFDDTLFNKISSEEADDNTKNEDLKLIGIDVSSIAINAAQKNVKNALLHKAIELINEDCLNYVPNISSGMIITNPPYGERLQKQNLVQFYSLFADILKNKYQGFDAWIISSNTDAMKYIGLHPSKKFKLFNGPLECHFNRYSIYAGSKKTNANNTQN